jgi:ABC-type multidrug transport system fused ATPase/permease subunit
VAELPKRAAGTTAAPTTGLDGLVEARGTNLSVGERQLLCLARAHLRSSKLLLLDEATASVDTVTDGKIQQTIRTDPRFASATRLIIAHRLQTIVDADTVVVMDNGRVGEVGPPRELLAKRPGDAGAMFAGLAADSGIQLLRP